MVACTECMNNTLSTNDTAPYPVCYPWVAKDLRGRNVSLDEVNAVVMKGTLSGIIFLGITIMLGTIGNAHVIFVFSQRKYNSSLNVIQRSINGNYRIFILWLAILGLCQCLISSPLLIVYLVYIITFPSSTLCKFFRFVLYLFPMTMNLTYIALAVERYLVICRTFRNRLTETHSVLICLSTILIGSCLATPAPILFGRGKTPTGIEGLVGYRCYLDNEQDKSIIKYFVVFESFLLVFFFVVVMILFILYTKIGIGYKSMLNFRRSSRRFTSFTPGSITDRIERTERQRIQIYRSVTICYVVCALPFHIIAILWFAQVIIPCDMNLPETQIFYVFVLSYYLSPVINPIIYGFQDDGFRSSVQAFYGRIIPRT